MSKVNISVYKYSKFYKIFFFFIDLSLKPNLFHVAKFIGTFFLLTTKTSKKFLNAFIYNISNFLNKEKKNQTI